MITCNGDEKTVLTGKRIKKLIYGMLFIAFFAVSLILSEESKYTLLASLELCGKTLVPSVFPFAVFGYLVGSGIGEFPRFLTMFVSRIFGVSESGAKVLLPGLFAGIPVGCGGAAEMYEREEIDERELCRICAFCTTPSAAFIISGVGTGMFGNKRVGILIYFSVILSVFVAGLITRHRPKKYNKSQAGFNHLNSPNIAQVLADAVAKSGYSMLAMSAFVVFFSQISLFLTVICRCIPGSEFVTAILKAIIEVSAASKSASEIGGKAGIFIAVFACAWSGLSVHMQTLAVCTQKKSKKLVSTIILMRAIISVLALPICFILSQVAGLY